MNNFKIGKFSSINALNSNIVMGKNIEIGEYVEIGEKADYDDLYKSPKKYERKDLIIKDNVIIKSHVTVHAPIFEKTEIGTNSMIMPFSHVAHDVIIGDNVHIALAKLGGHCKIHDYAYIGLNSATHQFVTVGAFSMVGGGSFVTKDIPPFLIYIDGKGCYKINKLGLERAGYSKEQIVTVDDYYTTSEITLLDKTLRPYIDKFKMDSQRKHANLWIEELVNEQR